MLEHVNVALLSLTRFMRCVPPVVYCECSAKCSSQGRLDDNFSDGNSEVVQAAMQQFPTLGTLEVTSLLILVTVFIITSTTIISISTIRVKH
jgi:hypothetical protein